MYISFHIFILSWSTVVIACKGWLKFFNWIELNWFKFAKGQLLVYLRMQFKRTWFNNIGVGGKWALQVEMICDELLIIILVVCVVTSHFAQHNIRLIHGWVRSILALCTIKPQCILPLHYMFTGPKVVPNWYSMRR